MKDPNETSADIIAEMETERPGLMNAPINTNNLYYARRLKAALERERGDREMPVEEMMEIVSESAEREAKLRALSEHCPYNFAEYNGDGGIGHVSIYIGGGQVVHASNPTNGIIISDIGYRTPCCATRLV